MSKKDMVHLSEKKKFYALDELKEMGMSLYIINKLVDDGSLSKINRNSYENMNYEGDESDFYYVSAYAPKGVVCLMSAAKYYNLTTYWPDNITVAMKRNQRISTMPEWPEFDVVYFSGKRYETGIETVREEENEFKIYDIEKTVTDIIFYRNKIGIEETKEILITYLNREDRNLNRLHRYAQALRCEKTLRTYLEVLL